MAVQNIKKLYRNKVGLEDLAMGVGTEIQTRNGKAVTITRINAANLPFDESETLETVLLNRYNDIVNLYSYVDKIEISADNISNINTNVDNIDSINANADNIDSINANADNMSDINIIAKAIDNIDVVTIGQFAGGGVTKPLMYASTLLTENTTIPPSVNSMAIDSLEIKDESTLTLEDTSILKII